MEPQIQYASTKDGVSIAFYAMGEGKPFVYMTSWPYQHLQLEWQWPRLSQYLEPILEKQKLIRFDGRGAGLSERSVSDYSLEARLLDLESVVERLGLETFDLLGHSPSGPLAIAYAARNPDRLSHLVLLNTFASAADFIASPKVGGLLALLNTDWELFTETAAHVLYGWSEGGEARRYAEFMRECTSHENAKTSTLAQLEVDVTELLPTVGTPTLVVQHRGVAFAGVDAARKLTSRIPNARLMVLEGDYGSPTQLHLGPILEFVGEGEAAAAAVAPLGLVTILFTDVEGSTALTKQLGDTKAREILREHERITREALVAHGGTEVKTMGDGFMASFGSVTKAVECAIALQRAFAEREGEPLSIRVGLNAGEPIEEEGDLFGATVIMASRIAASAEGGEILVSDNVRSLSAGKGFLFADRGEFVAKGFEEPVRVYEVSWQH